MGQRCCYGAEAALWGVAMGQRRGYGAEEALLWGRGGVAMGQRQRYRAALWGRGVAMGQKRRRSGAEALLWGRGGGAMGQRQRYGAEEALLWGRGGVAMGQRRRCYGAEAAMLWGRGGAMGRYLEGDDEVDLLPHAPDVGLAEVPREADFGALCGAQRRVGATHGCPTDTRAAHTERTDTPRRPITTPWRPHSAP